MPAFLKNVSSYPVAKRHTTAKNYFINVCNPGKNIFSNDSNLTYSIHF